MKFVRACKGSLCGFVPLLFDEFYCFGVVDGGIMGMCGVFEYRFLNKNFNIAFI